MSLVKRTTGGLLARFASRLRFPQLFVLTLLLFLVDLVVPDVVPLTDELVLGLLTLLFGSWKRHRTEKAEGPEGQPPPSPGTPSPGEATGGDVPEHNNDPTRHGD